MEEKTKTFNWGRAPWTINFRAREIPLPDEVDFAVIGGGFTGLSAAAWLKRIAPDKCTALFEADNVGAGSSGHTGGMTLAETAAGDLPGLGDVLEGFSRIQKDLEINCDHSLPGAWELARKDVWANSEISWTDSGNLGVAKEVPGGTANPGKLVSGLTRAAEGAGAQIFENAGVENILWETPAILTVRGKKIKANRILVATNAESLELSGLSGIAVPKFTLALATERLTESQLRAIGLDSHKPFYTTDMPYLWGRSLHDNQVIFGSGLVHLKTLRDLYDINVESGEASALMRLLETRVRGLHPELAAIGFTNKWGGPILIAKEWSPVFSHHPRSKNAIVLGAYSGHGVALSVYLGKWAAEAMTGKRKVPEWNAPVGDKG